MAEHSIEHQAGAYPRRAERVAFDLLVRYRYWAYRGMILMKDMTPYGARIEGLSDLRLGDEVTLLLPEMQPKDATIVWIDGQTAGVEFDHPLPGDVFNALVHHHARRRPTFEPAKLPVRAAA